MNLILDLLYIIAFIAYCPRIIYRSLRHGRYGRGIAERFGYVDRDKPDRKCIWIHAVSVGEVNATRTLVPALREKFGGYEIVITATTDTGYARAKKLYGESCCVFYFPFDFTLTMRRAIRRLDPNIILLMELEVWPNLAAIARKRKIPVVVINGRLSEKSFPRYKLIRPITASMFRKVSLFLVQSEEYARRFRYLGAPTEKVHVTNSLKYDTAADSLRGLDTSTVRKQLNIGTERLWVAGGTGVDEERPLLDVYSMLRSVPNLSDLRFAVVPRKPERFDEVAALIKNRGFDFVRYSEYKTEGKKVTGKPSVILVDTMGDLTKFYAFASIVFVGRSLVPQGGSDMMESATLGKCTLFGPYTFNFKQTVDMLLKAGGAVEVEDSNQLFHVMERCLLESDYSRRIAENGLKVMRQYQGATAESVKHIARIIEERNADKMPAV